MKTLNLISVDIYLQQAFRRRIIQMCALTLICCAVLFGIWALTNHLQAQAWQRADAQMLLAANINFEAVQVAADLQAARVDRNLAASALQRVMPHVDNFEWVRYILSSLPKESALIAFDYSVGLIRLSFRSGALLTIEEHRLLLTDLPHIFTHVSFGEITVRQDGSVHYEFIVRTSPQLHLQ